MSTLGRLLLTFLQQLHFELKQDLTRVLESPPQTPVERTPFQRVTALEIWVSGACDLGSHMRSF